MRQPLRMLGLDVALARRGVLRRRVAVRRGCGLDRDDARSSVLRRGRASRRTAAVASESVGASPRASFLRAESVWRDDGDRPPRRAASAPAANGAAAAAGVSRVGVVPRLRVGSATPGDGRRGGRFDRALPIATGRSAADARTGPRPRGGTGKDVARGGDGGLAGCRVRSTGGGGCVRSQARAHADRAERFDRNEPRRSGAVERPTRCRTEADREPRPEGTRARQGGEVAERPYGR